VYHIHRKGCITRSVNQTIDIAGPRQPDRRADIAFGAPLRPAVLEEFQWFCRTRRTKERSHPL
jgi:hypothetical protein